MSFVWNDKRPNVYFTQFHKRADKASLLTASGMLLHAFPSIFISSLREFPENCFIEYLHRKLLIANFLSNDIESAKKKVHLLDLHIKTIISF